MPRRRSVDARGHPLRPGDCVRSVTSGKLLTVLRPAGDEVVLVGGWRKAAVLLVWVGARMLAVPSGHR